MNTDTTTTADAAPLEYHELDPAPILADAAPKRKRGRPRKDATQPTSAKPRTTSKPTSKPAIDLAAKLGELLTVAGLMVGMANPLDGLIISSNAQQLATALGKLAEENEQVRRVLTGLVTGSAWGAVIMAAGSIALPIAANHGARLPMADAMLQPYRAQLAPLAQAAA